MAVAIVTGANSGISYWIACSLLDRGYQVAGFDRVTEAVDDLAAGCSDCLVAPVDVTRPEQIRAGVQAVMARFGRIDVLVNGACIAPHGPFLEQGADGMQRALDVNLLGYARMAEAVLPHLRSGGQIVFISSTAGLIGWPLLTGYAASKGGIEAFARSLSQELPHIRMAVVHPPLTRTPSGTVLGVPEWAMADPTAVGRAIAGRIYSRGTTPTGIGMAVLLLLSRIAPDLTGSLFSWAIQELKSPSR